MAASSMNVRCLTSLSKFTRSLLYTRPQIRCCTSKTSTEKTEAAEENKDTGEDVKVPDNELKLQAQKEKLEENLKELDDKYKRALAEVENVRQRMKKQIDDTKLFGIQGFCKDLFEVADILDQATNTVPKEEMEKNEHLKSLFQGMVMTNTQLLKVFSKNGLTKVDPEVGEKFDPHSHEALFQVPATDKQEDGTVAIVEKTGFKLHNRTLRPALVGVFKANS